MKIILLYRTRNYKFISQDVDYSKSRSITKTSVKRIRCYSFFFIKFHVEWQSYNSSRINVHIFLGKSSVSYFHHFLSYRIKFNNFRGVIYSLLYEHKFFIFPDTYTSFICIQYMSFSEAKLNSTLSLFGCWMYLC